MSEQLKIHNKKYIDATTAGQAVGYTNDYLTKLAREKKIDGLKVGRQWMISEQSLMEFVDRTAKEKAIRNKQIRRQRIEEQQQKVQTHNSVSRKSADRPKNRNPLVIGRTHAVVQTCAVIMFGVFLGGVSYVSFDRDTLVALNPVNQAGLTILSDLAIGLHDFVSPQPKERVVIGSSSDVTNSESVETTRYGLTVISPDDEEKIDAIRDAFSDEVEIDLSEIDTGSGIIRPRFQDRLGDPYNFLFVLLNSSRE